MARISVYIPDDLLEQARGRRSRSVSGSRSGPKSRSVSGSGSASDIENTSQLIQRGLQRLIADEVRAPDYAHTPDDVAADVARLRDRLVVEAREDYERGYTIALEAASAMPLWVINALVDAGFDLKRWLDPFRDGCELDMREQSKELEDPKEITRVILDQVGAPSPSDDRFRESPWWWLWKTAEALGDRADPIGFDEFSFTPTRPRQRGFIDAMRELWEAVEEPSTEDERRRGGDPTGARSE
jgi:hypothetical protein